MLSIRSILVVLTALWLHGVLGRGPPTSNVQVAPTNRLDLPLGLNISLISSYYFPLGVPFSAFFAPLLISPSFLTNTPPQRIGFSFGFLIDQQNQYHLAVCGGIAGSFTGNFSDPLQNGTLVPVWIGNLDSPRNFVHSSLFLVSVSDKSSRIEELQLQDQNGEVVWSVRNAGMLEMQDTGNLVIYNSANRSSIVWQSISQHRDILLQGQKLMEGMELTSNNGYYSARMEKGGLVLYLNKAHFIEDPSPYWVFPILFRNATNNRHATLNTLVLSSPCSPEEPAYSMLDNLSSALRLMPGSCRSNVSSIRTHYFYDDAPSLTFIKLEQDGRLYSYLVSANNESSVKYALGSNYEDFAQDGYEMDSVLNVSPFFAWGKCDVPMACGPFGVCIVDAPSLCICPHSFDLVDYKDFSKGCSRVQALPHCHTYEHIIGTDFLTLNQTASIFLFSGWTFASTSASVGACKYLCSSNCSCSGFIYQVNTSECFFISDGITLLHVIDKTLTYVEPLEATSTRNLKVVAKNYVTYLKVTSDANIAVKTTDKRGKAATIAMILSAGVAFTVIMFVAYIIIARKAASDRVRKQAKLEQEELRDILPLLPSKFSYQDLHKATSGFSKLLGAGGCGSVYAGVLADGRKVAVKVLESLMKGQTKQFLAEVATVGHTNHLNVVRLVGFCWEVSHRLLVYEFVERGSLDHWLFPKRTTDGVAPDPFLDWQIRYKVALGIARGLSYLHEECTRPILHFDIKPQNILLDDAFDAKLADFGMSRLMQKDISEVVTGVRGTPGYIAPEWLSHGAVSKKSDVYSMGMVLLEIVGGRRNLDLALLNNMLDSTHDEAWHFPSWAAKKCDQGLMMELVDKRLQSHGFDEEQAQRLIYTAFWCIQDDPGLRPYAPIVVQWLEGSSPLKQPPFLTGSAHTQSHGVPASLS